jgi:mono/diheme cytochrome c family protein
MNRSQLYPSTGRTANQLVTLEHIGFFAAPLGARPEELPVLPDPKDPAQPLEARARAYLHANCSHCHRPEGGAIGLTDFRFGTLYEEMGICNIGPSAGDLGVPGARLLVPGNPQTSLLSLRMHAADGNRMPPIARNVVDAAGVELIDAWITSLTSCVADDSIIVDNDEPGTHHIGNWGPSAAPNPYGASSVYSRNEDTSYTYDVTLPAAGTYDVYLWWTQWASRITAVPIDISHAAGTETITVNQQINGGRWNLAGRWSFGTTATVTIRSLGGGGSTCADAVRFVPRPAP